MQNQELKAQYEYPTKFNKFKRIMEMRNSSSMTPKPQNTESESDKKLEGSVDVNDVTMTTASSNHVFKHLSISDHPQPPSTTPHSSSQHPSSHPFNHQSSTSHFFIPSTNNSLTSHSSTHSSTTPSIHSPPKKLFINRSSDVQDTPLNLTTRTEPMDESNSSNTTITSNDNNNNNNKNNNNGYRSDDDDPTSDSPAAMDTSTNESMIIEDHFKRSLGSLYNNHHHHPSNSKPPSLKASRATPATPPSYPQKNPTENNSPKNLTPKHPNRYINPTIQTISPSVLINPFNFSLLTPLNTSPLDAVVAAAQLFNNNNNNTNFFSNNNNNMFNNNNNSAFFNHTNATNNNGNTFFNSFPPPVYNHNITKHQQQSPSHKHQQQHHQLQQQQLSPHHQQQQQLSPQTSKSPSLHHSSSFHGFKSASSSSPSPFKSTRRQRYTPPDSYQPYPHPITNPTHPNSHHLHPTPLTPPTYEGEVRKRLEVKKGEHLKRSNTSPAPQASISGSVDDHFSKSLGDVWKQVQATHHGNHANNSYASHSNSHANNSSKHSTMQLSSEQQQQRRKQPSDNNNNINRLQTYISEFAPELEDLIPTSVDDHFAKALGDKWLKIQADKSSPSSSSPHPSTLSSQPLPLLSPSSLSQQPSSAALSSPPSSSSSSFFRSASKGMSTHRGGLIISPTTKVKSPPSFYSSPSSFVIRS